MKNIQNSILDFAKSNKVMQVFLKFSEVFLLLYPIYLLCQQIKFLKFISDFAGHFSAPLYILYFVGLVLCFSKNNYVILSAAFIIKSVHRMFTFQYGVTFNTIFYLVFYAVLAGIFIVYAKNNYQWKKLKDTTMERVSKYATVAGEALAAKKEEYVFCTQCGNKCVSGTKFCDNCGEKMNDSAE